VKFKLKSNYQPKGDQPQAISALVEGIRSGLTDQVLLGVTGSGKTYTIANVIEQVQKPTLIISHNKTLAAQLYQEFREFFPDNGVGFFISYYDYYLPESYLPQTDTYIAKETEVNEEIDKLRLQATSLLSCRQDVIIVASVSCIYNIGSPEEYSKRALSLHLGLKINPRQLIGRLVDLYYSANNWDLDRGQFRKRENLIEVNLAYDDQILEIELNADRIVYLGLKRPISGKRTELNEFLVYPAKHYLADAELMDKAYSQIRADLKKRLKILKKKGKLIEAQRLEQRVEYDLEMIQELGYVSGIENYSRYFDGRKPGDPPYSLVDYFVNSYSRDFLLVVDESHITIPQIGGMYLGDKSRKETLIDFGFRLPSCLDNRPLKFEEFEQKTNQSIYVSATPADWEIKKSKSRVIEQLIRPTGLTEPKITIKPTRNQVEDLVDQILNKKKKGERVLVTTLTKRLAEDLSDYLGNLKNTRGKQIEVEYIHADVDTLQRSEILTSLRKGKYDVLVGVNLLREGLDLPEVSLVAILDADAQGFLRSTTSLIQTMGRAARNSAGEVILYADKITQAMRQAIAEVKRRRKVQVKYNKDHNITPTTIVKPIRRAVIKRSAKAKKSNKSLVFKDPASLTPKEIKLEIKSLKRKMNQLALSLEFEQAAKVRDQIEKLQLWLAG